MLENQFGYAAAIAAVALKSAEMICTMDTPNHVVASAERCVATYLQRMGIKSRATVMVRQNIEVGER